MSSESSPPTISVALATYNAGDFLDDQLDSLRSQTRPPLELIVSDDGSTDATMARLQNFAGSAPFPVRILENQRRLNVSDNFHRAAAECSGDYVAFCDQDDVWLARKLERSAAFLSSHEGIDVLVHTGLVVDERLRPTGARHPDHTRDAVVESLAYDPWYVPPGYAQVFSRRLLDIADFSTRPAGRSSPYQMVHDEWVFFIGLAVGRIGFSSEALVLHRRHGANLSGEPSRAPAHVGFRPTKAHVSTYVGAARLFREHAAYLRGAAWTHPGELRHQLLAAADFYDRHASLWRGRADLYAGSRLARGRRLASQAHRGSYRSRRRGGLGLRSLARDCASLTFGTPR